MKIEIGQTWISKNNPEQDFTIYGGDIDTLDDRVQDYTLDFEKQPESSKIFYWERANEEAFRVFIEKIKDIPQHSTFPYAWAGECKKRSIVQRIKKFDMVLKEEQ